MPHALETAVTPGSDAIEAIGILLGQGLVTHETIRVGWIIGKIVVRRAAVHVERLRLELKIRRDVDRLIESTEARNEILPPDWASPTRRFQVLFVDPDSREVLAGPLLGLHTDGFVEPRLCSHHNLDSRTLWVHESFRALRQSKNHPSTSSGWFFVCLSKMYESPMKQKTAPIAGGFLFSALLSKSDLAQYQLVLILSRPSNTDHFSTIFVNL